jgi:hypothetical protein
MPTYNVELWRLCPSADKPARGPDRNLFVEADNPEQAERAAIVYFELTEEAKAEPPARPLHRRVREAGNAKGVLASDILSPQAAPAVAVASSGAGGLGGSRKKG